MPRARTIVVGVVAIAAGLGAYAVTATIDDPDQAIGTVEVSQSPAQPAATDGGSSGTGGSSQQVAALDELVGTVTRDGDDVDDLEIGDVDMDFGPDAWVRTVGPLADFDGDGTVEPLADELDGLVGREVRLNVRFDDDGDDAEVYVIDGLTYREVGGPAPWQSADAVGEDAIRVAAAAAVGDGARVVELDPEAGSAVAWEAEVVDVAGREHDVLLDAAGNVLDVRAD